MTTLSQYLQAECPDETEPPSFYSGGCPCQPFSKLKEPVEPEPRTAEEQDKILDNLI